MLMMSAKTKDDLEVMINAYFFSSNYYITDDLELKNDNKPEFVKQYKITKSRGRYRLEK